VIISDLLEDKMLEDYVLKCGEESKYKELEEKCEDDKAWTDFVKEKLEDLNKQKVDVNYCSGWFHSPM